MSYLHANRLRFHVQVLTSQQPAPTPPRPKVVMIHGLFLANLATYYFTIAHPVANVADTYLYDLRGNGRTEMPPSGYAVSDHVADLHSLLTAWEIDEPVHLVANSFGGAIALAFTRLFPEAVASLVLIDVMLDAHRPTRGQRELPATRDALRRGEHVAALAAFGFDEETIERWRRDAGTRKQSSLARHGERLVLETSFIDDIRREQPLPDEALQTIGCPTLAVYGGESDLLDCAHTLERHLPHCELHIVPNCAHGVLSEATPLVRELTLAWLARFSPGESNPHPRIEGMVAP